MVVIAMAWVTPLRKHSRVNHIYFNGGNRCCLASALEGSGSYSDFVFLLAATEFHDRKMAATVSHGTCDNITRLLRRNSKPIFSTAKRVQTPREAFMERSRRDYIPGSYLLFINCNTDSLDMLLTRCLFPARAARCPHTSSPHAPGDTQERRDAALRGQFTVTRRPQSAAAGGSHPLAEAGRKSGGMFGRSTKVELDPLAVRPLLNVSALPSRKPVGVYGRERR